MPNGRTVVIGFDFGTHSSKVVYRVRNEREGGHILTFDGQTPDYPSSASPSLIREVNGKLYFGKRSLETQGGRLYRSLKVDLLHQPSTPRVFPAGFNCRSLIALYLAWAFQQVQREINREGDASVLLNLAAPMNYLENEPLKNVYLEIVQAAWQLSFGGSKAKIVQGISVEQAARLINEQLTMPAQPAEQRRFEILPETIAPIVSLSLDPFMDSGIYVIVDTGAGTTEISVFLSRLDANLGPRVTCYHDETFVVGGNYLEMAAQRDGNPLGETTYKIIHYLAKQYKRIWHKGYLRDSRNHTAREVWKKLILVLSGGGTFHEGLQITLGETNPMLAWPTRETDLSVMRHEPGTLDVGIDGDIDSISFFAVANGLSIEKMHWPKYFETREVNDLEPTEIEEKLASIYDP